MRANRVLLGGWILAFCLPLFAQDPTGVLRGQITDPSAATVPNAKVVAQNISTGFAATQESSQSGDFHFSYLPVGEYDLHVFAAGFADFSANRIRIDVDRTVNFAVSLELRSRGDLIDVTANAATVDISSTLGNVVSSQKPSTFRSTAGI